WGTGAMKGVGAVDEAGSDSQVPTAAVVEDGGFEEGTPNEHWDEFSEAFGTPICDEDCVQDPDYVPHTGEWWAWFGGAPNEEAAYVRQDLVIVEGEAELSFWLRIPDASGL